jgi:hypothetical protein
MVLALALPALGQARPQLEPLVPKSAQQPQEKRKPKKATPETSTQLPPLAPLTPPAHGSTTVGVLVLGALPDAVASRVSDGLRAVVKLAPPVKDAIALEAPQPCTNEACWVMAGAAANVDQVIVAAFSGGALRMKVVAVATRKQVAQAQQEGVSSDPVEATAWAEALACKLLVPAGCTGQVMVDAPEGVELALDGQPLRSGENRMVPVGVHTLRIKDGDTLSSRPFPVLYEGKASLALGGIRDAAPVASPPPAMPAPAAAVAGPPPAAPHRAWTRTAGYVTAGAAVVAAATGIYFGARSRSDLNKAESGYRSNGGAYQQSDLDALNSGNSAAHTANGLFIASGVLLAAGALLTFAF